MRSHFRLFTEILCLGIAVAMFGSLLGCGVSDRDHSKSVSKPDDDKPAPTVKWHETFEEALAESKSSGKPVLAEFTGSDWCPPCKALKKEVFDQPAFKRWANENVVLLVIDDRKFTPQSPEEKKRNFQKFREYNIQGVPAILFLDEKGVPFGYSGYMEGGADPWIKEADKILKNRPKKKAAAQKTAG